jgi:hypothetical protein
VIKSPIAIPQTVFLPQRLASIAHNPTLEILKMWLIT